MSEGFCMATFFGVGIEIVEVIKRYKISIYASNGNGIFIKRNI